ncbi:decaprenyl-phosphate phosphoribosyltransferase [Parvibium lacunae]|uniref:Decaprenyl-phosphate phosphoribosyltransferase n=1 Tax=Parvibium lacunae TaxID=1888893 RepID=A0A368KZ81_9BURK|nr:decaprenyl-phosphate phosphoribosyltransferase [Parvibium lacunae]RCS56676.1 decaprenyl-phosphate phosphoribosyltransferase [Parvibium lacunae]
MIYPAWLRLLRPHQWTKNAFILAGLVFGNKLLDSQLVMRTGLALVAFCLVASAIYVLNDYLDREADRQHPRKRHRPLASGAVSPTLGLLLALGCLSVGSAFAWQAGERVLGVVAAYLLLNLSYSWRLKHIAVLDVFCIAAGFMLRILAGTWAIGIPPSGWLLLTGMFFTLFLGFAKRRAEWVDHADHTHHLAADQQPARRKVLAAYSTPLLDSFLAITATSTVLSYGLYTLDSSTIALHGSPYLIATLPFVLFALFRYLLILHTGGKGENPSKDLFTDRPLLLCGAGYVTLLLILIGKIHV